MKERGRVADTAAAAKAAAFRDVAREQNPLLRILLLRMRKGGVVRRPFLGGSRPG
jgi:hypothetical protein